MALSENDKILLKHLGISEQDFEALSVAEQGKKLKEAMTAYVKDRSTETKPEYYENAKNVLPKIKEQLSQPVFIYAKNVGQNTKVSAYALAGYMYNKKKKAYLVFNPESDADILKTYQVDEENIVLSDK